MIIIGLTGSIGMGKSFVAKCFAKYGAAVFDADREVHKMLVKGGEAVEKVAEIFPEAKISGGIDRKKLGNIVFENKNKLRQLEGIIHPLVRLRRKEFLRTCIRQRKKMAVLDIPLLFETSAEKECDIIVVVSSPEHIQKYRIMKRGDISQQRFRKINMAQMPIKEKEKRADYIIKTGLDKRLVLKQVRSILAKISNY